MKMCYLEVRNRTREEYGWLFEGRDFEKEPYHKQRIENTKKLISRLYRGGVILDVGWDSHPMAYDFTNDEYVGIDFLFNDRKRYPRVQSIICSFDDLPFREDPIFDFIVWCEGPEHSLNPRLTMKGLRKVCRGRIFITCPPGSPVNWEHKSVIMDKDELMALIESQFKVLEVGDCPSFWIYGVGDNLSMEMIE